MLALPPSTFESVLIRPVLAWLRAGNRLCVNAWRRDGAECPQSVAGRARGVTARVVADVAGFYAPYLLERRVCPAGFKPSECGKCIAHTHVAAQNIVERMVAAYDDPHVFKHWLTGGPADFAFCDPHIVGLATCEDNDLWADIQNGISVSLQLRELADDAGARFIVLWGVEPASQLAAQVAALQAGLVVHEVPRTPSDPGRAHAFELQFHMPGDPAECLRVGMFACARCGTIDWCENSWPEPDGVVLCGYCWRDKR